MSDIPAGEQKAGQIQLSIIVVSYNTRQLLEQCIRSVYEHTTHVNFELIVIDNNSSDGSPQMIRENFENAKLICNDKNVGFGSANNQGMRISRGKFLLLLNSDTIVFKDSILKLVQLLEQQPQIGMVGPKVLNKDWSLQPSFGTYPDLKSEFLRACLLDSHLTRRAINRDARINGSEPFAVDWVSGCCLMLRKPVFEQTGGFDENFFLFNEEVDWCLRARKAGWQIAYFPGAEIVHFGGKSVKQDYFTFISSRYETRLRFAEKHFHFIKKLLFRIIGVFALLVRLGLITFAGAANKNEQSGRRKAYWQSLLLYLGIKKIKHALKC